MAQIANAWKHQHGLNTSIKHIRELKRCWGASRRWGFTIRRVILVGQGIVLMWIWMACSSSGCGSSIVVLVIYVSSVIIPSSLHLTTCQAKSSSKGNIQTNDDDKYLDHGSFVIRLSKVPVFRMSIVKLQVFLPCRWVVRSNILVIDIEISILSRSWCSIYVVQLRRIHWSLRMIAPTIMSVIPAQFSNQHLPSSRITRIQLYGTLQFIAGIVAMATQRYVRRRQSYLEREKNEYEWIHQTTFLASSFCSWNPLLTCPLAHWSFTATHFNILVYG